MGLYNFGLRMLKADLKLCVLYVISIIFSTAVIFNFFNIMFNSNFSVIDSNYSMIYKMEALGIIFIAILFVFFCNSYFITGKAKGLSIVSLSGISIYRLIELLLYQTFIIMIIALPLGLLIGISIMPTFILLMYKILGISGSVWIFSMQGFVCTIAVMAMEVFFLVLVNAGYAYKKDIKDLLAVEKQLYTPDKKVLNLQLCI